MDSMAYCTAVCTVAVINTVDGRYGYVGTASIFHVDSGFYVLFCHVPGYEPTTGFYATCTLGP
jgi:hypothetical protein